MDTNCWRPTASQDPVGGEGGDWQEEVYQKVICHRFLLFSLDEVLFFFWISWMKFTYDIDFLWKPTVDDYGLPFHIFLQYGTLVTDFHFLLEILLCCACLSFLS